MRPEVRTWGRGETHLTACLNSTCPKTLPQSPRALSETPPEPDNKPWIAVDTWPSPTSPGLEHYSSHLMPCGKQGGSTPLFSGLQDASEDVTGALHLWKRTWSLGPHEVGSSSNIHVTDYYCVSGTRQAPCCGPHTYHVISAARLPWRKVCSSLRFVLEAVEAQKVKVTQLMGGRAGHRAPLTTILLCLSSLEQPERQHFSWLSALLPKLCLLPGSGLSRLVQVSLAFPG